MLTHRLEIVEGEALRVGPHRLDDLVNERHDTNGPTRGTVRQSDQSQSSASYTAEACPSAHSPRQMRTLPLEGSTEPSLRDRHVETIAGMPSSIER